MGYWSSSKYSTDYEDEVNEEVNQPTLSPKHEEYPLPVEEPTEDDEEPIDEEEKEAPVVQWRRRWPTSPRPFHQGSSPCRATRSVGSTLHPPT